MKKANQKKPNAAWLLTLPLMTTFTTGYGANKVDGQKIVHQEGVEERHALLDLPLANDDSFAYVSRTPALSCDY
jgi:hypothetical protein